jgi:hypothetical protein
VTTYDAYTRVSNNQSLIGVPLALSSSIPILTDIPASGGPLAAGGLPKRNIGDGADLVFRIHVTEAISGGGFTSLTVTLLAAQDDALTISDLLCSVTIPAAKCAVGAEFDVNITSSSLALQLGPGHAYIGLLYTMTGGNPTSGAVSAYIPLHSSPSPVAKLGANYVGPS